MSIALEHPTDNSLKEEFWTVVSVVLILGLVGCLVWLLFDLTHSRIVGQVDRIAAVVNTVPRTVAPTPVSTKPPVPPTTTPVTPETLGSPEATAAVVSATVAVHPPSSAEAPATTNIAVMHPPVSTPAPAPPEPAAAASTATVTAVIELHPAPPPAPAEAAATTAAAPPSTPAAATMAPEPSLQLLAITPGRKPEAIIQDAHTQHLYFVHQGDAINGLTVQRMTDDQVILHGEHGDLTLSL